LPEVDGEVQGDIVQYFMRLSGLALGPDAAGWGEWWNARKANFQFPAAAEARGPVPVPKNVPSYYGIGIYARRVIFVLDTSGSMRGQRLASARQELIKTIEGLPPGTSFNVVSFNSTLAVWNRSLMPATKEVKAKACQWIAVQEAEGDTHTFDALRTTLDQQPEAIYLLTDGKPKGGTIGEPKAILQALQQTNRYRRTSIHVIGVHPGPEESLFSQFLVALAAQNWGQYRRVE
jgi:hypothetical protein